MTHYEYFGPQGQRRTKILAAPVAARSIGERAMMGFPLVQRHVRTPTDTPDVSLVYFQSEATGVVWAVYYDG